MKKSIKGLNCKFFKNIVLSSSLGFCVACGNDLEKYNLNDVEYLKVNEVENLEKLEEEQIKDFWVKNWNKDFNKNFTEECVFFDNKEIKIKTENNLYVSSTNSLVFKIVSGKKEVILVGYSDEDKLNNIVFNIPKKVCFNGEEYLVTYIGNCSFCDCKFKQVNFPSSIRRIGASAFCRCKNLREVSFKGGTESDNFCVLEYSVFKDCTNLDSVCLPKNLTEIGSSAFSGCEMLKEIFLPDRLKSISSGLFRNCGELKSVYLPNGLLSIEDNGFSGCIKLEKILLNNNVNEINKLPDNICKIGSSAFRNCEGLRNIKLPESLLSIGEDSFRCCINLEEVKMSNNIKRICRGAFKYCEKLENISFETCQYLTVIEESAFANSGLKGCISIPVNVFGLEKDAFKSCSIFEICLVKKSPLMYEDIVRACGDIRPLISWI